MRLLNEIDELKQRFKIPDTKFVIGEDDRVNIENPAVFWNDNTIVMIDKDFEPQDLVILLHEIGHAIQFRDNRLTTNKKVDYFALEIEAEMFAVYWGEFIYGVRRQQWKLGDYEDYLQVGGFTEVRRATNTPAGVFMHRYERYINPVILKNLHDYYDLVDGLRQTPADKWTCERGTPIVILN